MYIELSKDKEPYIKKVTDDQVINLTGESGSGKSYFSRNFNSNEYIVIDSDEVFSRYDNSSGYNRVFGKYFREKYAILPSIIDDFDTFYREVVDYFSDSGKILVIDSAQFRNLKDISLLRGTVIIMRTSINTCYDRCISRWISLHSDYSLDELEKYKERKKGIYSWYLKLNKFIERVDSLK